MSKFVITDRKQVDQVLEWHRTGRGIYLWTSKEIGTCRPDIITPGDATQAPHWAYVGQPESMTLEEIEFADRESRALVPEDFPVCTRCGGSGVRELQEIADIRGCAVADLREEFRTRHPWPLVDDDHFQCNFCKGGGHDVKPITGRGKRTYWGGIEFSETLQKKAAKMAKRLEQFYNDGRAILFDYEWEWANTYRVVFYVEKVTRLSDML